MGDTADNDELNGTADGCFEAALPSTPYFIRISEGTQQFFQFTIDLIGNKTIVERGP